VCEFLCPGAELTAGFGSDSSKDGESPCAETVRVKVWLLTVVFWVSGWETLIEGEEAEILCGVPPVMDPVSLSQMKPFPVMD